MDNNSEDIIIKYFDGLYIINILEDGRIVCKTDYKGILILNKNNFQVEKRIKYEDPNFINNLIQLNNTYLILWAMSNSNIYKFNLTQIYKNYLGPYPITLFKESEKILQVIEIDNKTLVSLSKNNIFKLWVKSIKLFEKEEKYYLIKEIKIKYNDLYIIKVRRNLIVSSSEEYIRFLGINNNNIIEIKKIDINTNLMMCMSNKNTLLVSGKHITLYVINTKVYQIILKLELDIGIISSILILPNKNILILCKDYDKKCDLVELNYKTFEQIKCTNYCDKEKLYDKDHCLTMLDNENIITSFELSYFIKYKYPEMKENKIKPYEIQTGNFYC